VAALNSATPTPGLLSPAYVSGTNKVTVDLVGDSDGSCAASCAVDVPGQGGARHADDELRQWAIPATRRGCRSHWPMPIERARSGQGRQQFATVTPARSTTFSAADLAHVTSSANADPSARARPLRGREGGCDLRADRDRGRRLQRNAIGQRRAVTVNPLSPGIASGSFGATKRIQWSRHGNFTYSEAATSP